MAITNCCDGAMQDIKVSENADDPTVVKIEFMQRQTALESKDWQGFTSNQL